MICRSDISVERVPQRFGLGTLAVFFPLTDLLKVFSIFCFYFIFPASAVFFFFNLNLFKVQLKRKSICFNELEMCIWKPVFKCKFIHKWRLKHSKTKCNITFKCSVGIETAKILKVLLQIKMLRDFSCEQSTWLQSQNARLL